MEEGPMREKGGKERKGRKERNKRGCVFRQKERGMGLKAFGEKKRIKEMNRSQWRKGGRERRGREEARGEQRLKPRAKERVRGEGPEMKEKKKEGEKEGI